MGKLVCSWYMEKFTYLFDSHAAASMMMRIGRNVTAFDFSVSIKHVGFSLGISKWEHERNLW